MRLTDIRLRALTPPEKGAKVYYCDSLQGFGVRVSQGGTKAFILATGKNRDRVTIGRWPIVGLAEAREVAKNLLAERQLGRHQSPAISLGAAVDLFTEQHVAKLAPRTRQELARLFVRYLPKLRAKKLGDVTTHDLTAITDKAAPSEAEHFHRACKTLFRWCVRRRLLQHSPLEGLELPSKWQPRERVLSDDELRAVWNAAEATAGSFGVIVRMLIMTGARRGEIGAMKPQWIDLENEKLTIPSEATKNGRPHSIPIGKVAISILKSQATLESPRSETFLFPARGKPDSSFNGWSKAKVQLDKLTLVHWNKEHVNSSLAPWTLHDLRRTYATNLQRIGIRLEVIEALLNHVSGTRTGIVGVYNRHRYETEMRDAVGLHDDWFAKIIVR